MKSLVQKQYAHKINQLREATRIATPPEGWIRTFRKALGMSSRQLAARLGLGQAQVTQMERLEVEDRITLRQLRRVAEALDAKLVYALVPERPVDETLQDRARHKAEALVGQANTQMQLEKQQLTTEEIEVQVQQETRRLLENLPRDFWDD